MSAAARCEEGQQRRGENEAGALPKKTFPMNPLPVRSEGDVWGRQFRTR